jgi:predicted nucleotidyltransferase
MVSQEINTKIVSYLKQYHPSMVGVFGSYARNEQTKFSDIDVLIDFKSTLSLLELVHIEQELSEILGIKVDLVTKSSLKNTKLIHYIQQDLQVIYE